MLFPGTPRRAAAVLSLLALFAPCARAALTNITIDDTFGDPVTGARVVYAPANAWSDQTCVSCDVRADVTQASSGTWHSSRVNGGLSASSLPSATVTFNGSAVFVYAILADTTSSPAGQSSMTFALDGAPFGAAFTHIPDGSSTYQSGAPVYSNTGLQPGLHTLVIRNDPSAGDSSLVVLDSIVYSTDFATTPPFGAAAGATAASVSAASPSTPSVQVRANHDNHQQNSDDGPPTVVVAVAVVFSLIVLGLVGGAGWWWWRRRGRRTVRKGKTDASFAIEDAPPPPRKLSEMRMLPTPLPSPPARPALALDTGGGLHAPRGANSLQAPRAASGLFRKPSTMSTATSVPMSPALASSVDEYAPYGTAPAAPPAARVSALLRKPSTTSTAPLSPALASSVMEYAPYGTPPFRPQSGRPPAASRRSASRASRVSRQSHMRSMLYAPSTIGTESYADHDGEMPAGADDLERPPLPPLPVPQPAPVKEDRPARVVRVSDLPRASPLPMTAARLLDTVAPLPPTPAASRSQLPPAEGPRTSRRLPVPPPRDPNSIGRAF